MGDGVVLILIEIVQNYRLLIWDKDETMLFAYYSDLFVMIIGMSTPAVNKLASDRVEKVIIESWVRNCSD